MNTCETIIILEDEAMENQEIPFDNYNTLDYAMHLHDIERIEEVEFVEINARLKEGWALLALHNVFSDFLNDGRPYSDVWGYMGVPRPQFCTIGFSKEHPQRVQKIWDHQNNEWECRYCTEHDAHRMNEKS